VQGQVIFPSQVVSSWGLDMQSSSAVGITSPSHAPNVPSFWQVCFPALHVPMPSPAPVYGHALTSPATHCALPDELLLDVLVELDELDDVELGS
jgi:hypothetical protein